MFNFLKSNKNKAPVEQTQAKTSLLASLTQGLKKTRDSLTSGLATLILGKKFIDQELLDEIETRLLIADIGVEATQKIIQDLTTRVSRKQLNDAESLWQALQTELKLMLQPCSQPLIIPKSEKPFVLLMVGVNGNGKTTTIGKLAKHLQQEGKKVMLAAGDTYRAAAIEQLEVWGERNQIPVIAQQSGADSAAVIFDAFQAATARGIDVLIADTAGRLHTQTNLMEELKKIRRVLSKIDPAAPHEVMLVLDAATGQNALRQAQQFQKDIGVTGITLTKLDGTAKGGIIFAICEATKLPVRFIGIGEKIDDLKEFNADDFVTALFD